MQLHILYLLVKQLRSHQPDVHITIQGEAGLQSSLLLAWCDRHRGGYIRGFGDNVKLKRHIQDDNDALSAVWEVLETQELGRDGVKLFDVLPYQAGSWRRERRVIATLEHNAIGAKQRYIVTSLEGEAEQLYSDVCSRKWAHPGFKKQSGQGHCCST